MLLMSPASHIKRSIRSCLPPKTLRAKSDEEEVPQLKTRYIRQRAIYAMSHAALVARMTRRYATMPLSVIRPSGNAIAFLLSRDLHLSNAPPIAAIPCRMPLLHCRRHDACAIFESDITRAETFHTCMKARHALYVRRRTTLRRRHTLFLPHDARIWRSAQFSPRHQRR